MADDIVSELRNHPYTLVDCACVRCQAADEIERLRRWKTEATTVLAEWDAVWECAGKGTLGESKQRGVVAELGRLDDENERLRAENAEMRSMLYEVLNPLPVEEVIAEIKRRYKEARRG